MNEHWRGRKWSKESCSDLQKCPPGYCDAHHAACTRTQHTNTHSGECQRSPVDWKRWAKRGRHLTFHIDSSLKVQILCLWGQGEVNVPAHIPARPLTYLAITQTPSPPPTKPSSGSPPHAKIPQLPDSQSRTKPSECLYHSGFTVPNK